MNNALSRSTITLLVILAVLVTATAALYNHPKPARSVAGQQQAGPVLPATAYSDLVNGLSAAGGR